MLKFKRLPQSLPLVSLRYWDRSGNYVGFQGLLVEIIINLNNSKVLF